MARAALLALLPLSLFASEEQERNKALARRFYEEAWFKGNPQAAVEIFAPRYKVFDPRGRMGVLEPASAQADIARRWCVDNGDCSKSEIVWQMADGDRVATYWIFRQMPRKPLLRLLGLFFGQVPIERRIINVFRFDNGRIVEMTNQRDDLGIYADMGVINTGIVALFALGGAMGIGLVWLINKIVRRPSP
jgi:predicted SnoaL-like aldol condensation-catalyzing enzyme